MVTGTKRRASTGLVAKPYQPSSVKPLKRSRRGTSILKYRVVITKARAKGRLLRNQEAMKRRSSSQPQRTIFLAVITATKYAQLKP